MFWDEEISPEEEEEIIESIARKLYRYGLETAGILFLESLRPISRYASSMGQVVVSPLLPFLGDNLMMKGDKTLRIFEREENVEKLIQRLEDLAVTGLESEKALKHELEYRENDETSIEGGKG